VIFLSFPKSGRTWHRVLLGSYLAMLAKKPMNHSLRIGELTQLTGGRQSLYSHNAANFNDGRRLDDPRVADPSEWAGRCVLLLVRDPRDVLVSAYHHSRYREGQFDGELGDFVRDPDRGIDKLLTAWNRWDQNRARARSFEVVSYESMLADAAAVLRHSLRLIDVPVDENLVDRAVQFASFENMKRYEQTDFFGDEAMRNRQGRVEASKVREGRAGGHTAHLNRADLDFIESRCTMMGDPFRAVWSSSPAAPTAHRSGRTS